MLLATMPRFVAIIMPNELPKPYSKVSFQTLLKLLVRQDHRLRQRGACAAEIPTFARSKAGTCSFMHALSAGSHTELQPLGPH